MNDFRLAVAPWVGRMGVSHDLAPGSLVVVGCSGGADSLALVALARACDLDVVAVYVDHGLRVGTAHDAAVVGRAVAEVGAALQVVAVDVDARANVEARARDARYAALARVAADDVGAAAILVGHTRDDQAETVLLALLRGSGTAGLSGMPATRGPLRRPLLEMRRADTREICARLGWAPVLDPMNDDLRYRRVWLRREVMPRLEAGARRDLVEVLARQAAVVRADDELLDELASVHAADDARALAALPLALARRVVRRWLGPPPPESAVVDAVLEVARGQRRAVDLAGDRRIERAGTRLQLVSRRRAGTAGNAGHLDVSGAGPLRRPHDRRLGRGRSAGRLARRAPVRSGRRRPCRREWHGPGRTFRGAVPAARTGRRHQARARCPGRGRRARHPAARVAPVVFAGTGAAVPADSALWVVGYRIDDRVRVASRTRRYLWMSADPC